MENNYRTAHMYVHAICIKIKYQIYLKLSTVSFGSVIPK